MRNPLFLIPLLLSTLHALAAPVPIFDGKSLEGWEGDPKLWRVEDGMITGGSLTEKVTHNDFIATVKSYANFDLRVKIKLSGTDGFINSGVQIRSLRVPGSPEMSGYQVDYGKGWYGKLYDESRRNKVVAESKDMAAATAAIHEADWNEYRVRTDGPRIQSWINGVPALDYTEPDPNIAQDGHIGIQVHGGGKALVQVKEVTIEELPPTPDAPTWEKVGKPGDKKKEAAATPPAAKRDISYNAVAAVARTPEEELATFQLPEGFVAELVAAESEGVGKFVPITFDQKGALWTTTAFEYPVDGNENPAAADALYASKAKDKVLIYDRDPKSPTGYASKPRVFADGLAIPLGVLPYKNGCYVLHGHDIVFMEDTDGDGKADKTTVILTGFGVQDSHLFPHQFTRAPGGWIWMAQGAFNYGKVRRPEDAPEKAVQFDQTRMARFRPDGSGFDITSNGPCNIWGLVLNGEGEAFIQEANDFGYPVMPFHEYGNYPGCSDRQWKSYAPEFPGTAPDFRMGGTGLSGLALTDKAGPFPEPWRDMMLVANPITNRIQAIKMHRDGPYWKLDKPLDFLVSNDPWFRPVATTIGPDGCLYIVDWYNKIISHNEVPRNHPDRDKTRGRIWRVKATAAKPFDVPDFSKLSGDELIAKLGGESLAQSHLAWQAIGDREMVGALREKLDAIAQDKAAAPARRIQALWTLEEQGYQGASPGLLAMAKDSNRNVRREALRSCSYQLQWYVSEYADEFKAAVTDADQEVRATVIRWLGNWFHQEGAADPAEQIGLATLLRFAREPLTEPVAPSTRNGKPIKVRESYDREFERYLVRMFLERYPDVVAKYLDSPAGRELPVEARLLATFALEPKASAPRVAKLLPQLERAPGQEEVLRLAQFPDEPGVGEALRAVLSNPKTSAAALESLLAVKTRLDASKLTPLFTETARTLLASADPAALDLGIRLASAFQLGETEDALVAALQKGMTKSHVWPLRGGPLPPRMVGAHTIDLELTPAAMQALKALRELRSDHVALFDQLARFAVQNEVRDEALLALATSRSPKAGEYVLELWPQLEAFQRRAMLERLVSSKAGASTVVAAIKSAAIAKTEIDGSTVDKLQAVLGDDAGLAALMQELGALFRPVLALDGSDAAWTQTSVTLDGPCTIEAWVRLDPEKRKIGNADGVLGAPGQLDINFFGEKPRVYAYPPLGDVVVAKKPVMPGLWTHLAFTRSAAGLWKIYFDGELDATATKAAPGKIENARIAWTAASGGSRGAISEFRIWNRERTADEIRSTCDRSLGIGKPDSGVKAGVPPGHADLIFASASGDWGKLQAGARVVKTSDYPPILSPDEAAMLDEKYAKNRARAEKPGDPERGKLVAAVCQACHLMGPIGGNIGPNLSGVGAMGTEGILRNVLQPNAAMENGYRIYRIEMKSGDLLDALFVSEDKDAVVIRMPGSEDRRIPKKDIRDAKYLRRSLMPEGLLDTMTAEQVSDLFAYLRTLK